VLRSGSPLPSLDGATRWLNRAITTEELLGRPVLVHFWAISCHLCKENQPALQQWEATYGARGVAFISIHMPRQESDTRIESVEEAARISAIEGPLAVDNEHVLGQRFETDGLWPLYLLFDAEGKLRARAAGAAGLGVLGSALERIAPAPPPEATEEMRLSRAARGGT
jgi:thiol-disulfide isomerase/thioredoxin